jgi:hypothetical protein
LKWCCGPRWNVSNLVEDILSTYYKGTLSAITRKLNVSGQFFLFCFVELVPKIGPHLSLTTCIIHIITAILFISVSLLSLSLCLHLQNHVFPLYRSMDNDLQIKMY